MRPLWFTDLLKKGFPHRFVLARLTRVPVLGRVMDYLFFEDDDIIYLPRDNVVTMNVSVVPESVVLPSQVVEYFIEKSPYLWVMNACICRDSLQCKDYPIDLGCLFMGEAALRINPQLGRRVTKEEALQHLKKCREAGLVHLIGRNKLDAVWLNVTPGHKLLTVCNCCPCCCLWRMLPHLSPDIGGKVTKMPGVTVSVGDACVGCGTCAKVCFVKAASVVEGKAVISGECRGCGRCVERCPERAISISYDPQFVEKSVERISGVVDIS